MRKPVQSLQFLYATPPMPCPYLPGRTERRVVTELTGGDAGRLHDLLSRAGFRRSHSIAYAPACPGCNACQAIRVVVEDFQPSRSHRRVLRLNRGLTARLVQASATLEQYELFSVYQKSRHASGDMAKMDYFDYQALIEDSPVDTALAEFRDAAGELVAICLVDLLGDGLSAVYSFFSTSEDYQSLGTLMVLWLIDLARAKGMPYVYLGYWIADCAKMSYKVRFRPVEVRTSTGWKRLDADVSEALTKPRPRRKSKADRRNLSP
jgi:arginyl-tRNA--protein-N-Asp/Glu arginylyltransferase